MPRLDKAIIAAMLAALLGWPLSGCATKREDVPTSRPPVETTGGASEEAPTYKAPSSEAAASDDPAATSDESAATSDEPAATFPSPLVGIWESTGPGAALLVYKFDENGTYRHAGVLNQQRASGVFSFEIAVMGQAEADGETLILRPAAGTKTLRDPDSPSSSYRDRPMDDLSPERYAWRMADGMLKLTSDSGDTISYKRSG
ncbi:hypothetical protein HCN51_21610 [Nonomuraea sp. FMUSA5-5]|uniref:Lipoprotein n=1 Tax=Nonomuraea composti TaxID=2720023 RepID=A0ABX1B8G8_9ACTN|nr:hypothetical protein [Nonomuraea sp. FMUSA5-5]NJP92026.1 hypothetical protein [Nonomuraea sp. FMUSA5-5]